MDDDFINIRKTDSDGEEQWYKSYDPTDMYWNFAALSQDGATIAAIVDIGDMALMIVDTSDGSNVIYYNDTYVNFPSNYDGDNNIVFSPSDDYIFFEAASDGDQYNVGFVCRFDITDEEFHCKDFVNGESGGGMVAGYDVFNDDEIIVHYVIDNGSTLMHRFARYNYDSDDFDWIVEFECIDL